MENSDETQVEEPIETTKPEEPQAKPVDELTGLLATVIKNAKVLAAEKDHPVAIAYLEGLKFFENPRHAPISWHLGASQGLGMVDTTQGLRGFHKTWLYPTWGRCLPLRGARINRQEAYEWAGDDPAVRDNNGKRVGDHHTLRVFAGPALPNLLRAHDLPVRWVGVQQEWWAEVRLEDVPALVSLLRSSQRAGVAAALELLCETWEAAAKVIDKRRSAETEKILAAREARAAELGIEAQSLPWVRRMARAVLRLRGKGDAAPATLMTLAETEQIVADIFQLDSNAVQASQGYTKDGDWLVGSSGTIAIALGENESKYASTWHRGVSDKHGLPKPKGSKYGARYHLTWSTRWALKVSRALEDVGALEMSVWIRLAVCIDPDEVLGIAEDVASSEMNALVQLADARNLDDIIDPVLRAHVEGVIADVPYPNGKNPYPHQEIAIAYATIAGYRCLIGDSPGVGKTSVAMGCLSLSHQDLLPALVVAPASVVFNWRNELNAWAPWFDIEVIEHANEAIPPPDERTVYVCSWDMLALKVDELLTLGLNCAVFDESHMGKNAKAKRSIAAAQIAHSTFGCLLLTGTAMENAAIDLWHQLHMLNPQDFPDPKSFKLDYGQTAVRHVRGNTIVDDAGDNLEELGWRIRPYMIRRLKSDVLTQLPDKTRRSIWIDLDERTTLAYKTVQANLFTWMAGQFRARSLEAAAVRFEENLLALAPKLAKADLAKTRTLHVEALTKAVRETNEMPPAAAVAAMAAVKMVKLRQLIGKAKVAHALTWIAACKEEQGHEFALVVFIEHKDVLALLGKGLQAMGIRWTYINGGVAKKKRTDRIAAFQAGEFDVIIGSQAMHAGVTLTRASTVLFVERWWNPSREEQGEDRTHRIGQKSAVICNYLMAKDTVDEHISALVDTKRRNIAAVLGAETVEEGKAETAGEVVEGSVQAALARSFVRQVATDMGKGGSAGRIGLRDLAAYLKTRKRK